MLFKLVFLLAAALASADDPPKKFYRVRDDQQMVSPLRDPFDNLDYRLPNTTIPIRYDVWLTTDIHRADFGFYGRVTIQILALQNTPNITLHYRQLTVTNVKLSTAGGQEIQENVPTTMREDLEFLIITPTQPLIMNQIYVVEILYSGILRTDEAGFYRSSYVDTQGQVKWLATTQFESTDARHGFPW
jgi:aminopeptidase N